ncbi:MAG: hypothetical protein QXS20_00285 [Candidatus Thorarchaeota archaeon]
MVHPDHTNGVTAVRSSSVLDYLLLSYFSDECGLIASGRLHTCFLPSRQTDLAGSQEVRE